MDQCWSFLFRMVSGLLQLANSLNTTLELSGATIADGMTAIAIILAMSFGLIVPKVATIRIFPLRSGLRPRSAFTKRVAKAVLIGAVPPLMLKTPANPAGTPMEAFDQIRAGVVADRSQFWKDLSIPFYGYNRPGAKISEGVRESFWLQGMMAGFPASYFCIKPFSETDLTEDLKKIDVPTLILHGDDDQIVPIGASAMLSSKLIKNATLKVYAGAPHGMCTTLKDRVNEDLLGYFKA